MQEGFAFLKSFFPSGIKPFGVFFLMMGVFFLIFANKKKPLKANGSLIGLFIRAQDYPDIQLDRPLAGIIAEVNLALKRYTVTLSVLVMILGVVVLIGLVNGLQLFLAFFVISFIMTLIYTVSVVRFWPYRREIRKQMREFNRNKKGL